MLASLPTYTPPEKLDNLLQLIAEMSHPQIGKHTSFDEKRDYPLLIASGQEEVSELISVLLGRGLVLIEQSGMGITMTGWEHLAEIRRRGRTSTRAFVAMWFADSVNPIYENGIAPAISDAGYEPLRIDLHQHVNRINGRDHWANQAVSVYGG